MGAVVTLNSPPTGIIYPTAADAPYPERAERKLRRMRTVQDFGAIADYDPVTGLGTDNTEAFNRALASGKMVWVPGDDVDPERGLTGLYKIAGVLNAANTKTRLYGEGGEDGRAHVFVTHSNKFLDVTAPSARIRSIGFHPVQANTSYGILINPTAAFAQLRDVAIYEGNSGFDVRAPKCDLVDLWCSEMQGSAGTYYTTARGTTVTRMRMRNVCLAGNLCRENATQITFVDPQKWTDPAYYNDTIQNIVDALFASSGFPTDRLGGEAVTMTAGTSFIGVLGGFTRGARDGSLSLAGFGSWAVGYLAEDGYGSGIGLSGINLTATNCRAIRCKTGFRVVSLAGNVSKHCQIIGGYAYDSVEAHYRFDANITREWIAGRHDATAANFYWFRNPSTGYYGVYQCSDSTDCGTIAPVHLSGTVSDGIQDLTYVGGDPITLDSDLNMAVACSYGDSGTPPTLGREPVLYGSGRALWVGPDGGARDIPAKSGISGPGRFYYRGQTTTGTAKILTTDGGNTSQQTNMRLRPSIKMRLTGTITAMSASDHKVWQVDRIVTRDAGTTFTDTTVAITAVAATAGAASWTLTATNSAAVYEVQWTATGAAGVTIDWLADITGTVMGLEPVWT